MMKIKIGSKIGKWTVLGYGKRRGTHQMIRYRCKCGLEKDVYLTYLINGKSKQCTGCAVRARRENEDLSGKKFGEWTIIKRVDNRYDKRHFLCRCSCGNEKIIAYGSLRSGISTRCTSCCGIITGKRSTTHGYCSGGKKTPEYHIWHSMIERCRNPNNKGWKNYGGRKITVCERWKSSFPNFLEDMGKKPFPKASIDRIDNNGNYCPENCRWATKKEQAENKRNSTLIIYNDEKTTITEFSRENNICRFFVSAKLKEGLSVEEIIKLNNNPIFKDYGNGYKKSKT